MRGIKIPQQDFALKMPGGLCARGGVFVGHYGIFTTRSDDHSVFFTSSQPISLITFSGG